MLGKRAYLWFSTLRILMMIKKVNFLRNHGKGTRASSGSGGYRPVLYTNKRFHYIFEIVPALLFVYFADNTLIIRPAKQKVNTRTQKNDTKFFYQTRFPSSTHAQVGAGSFYK